VDATTAATLDELAQEPGLWLPPQPGYETCDCGGCVVATHGRSAWVQRIRLTGDVAGAVGRVRAYVRDCGLAEAVWWVGDHSTPHGLAAALRRLGLEPAEPAALTCLGIDHTPHGTASAEVRRADTRESFLGALEIDWEAFAVPEAERALRRVEAEAAWPQIRADGRSATYLASLDGRSAGFARAAFTPQAALLLGGATLAWARGRGVYTSTVLARFADAAERGVPRVAVSAGPMSAPVLERVGFVPLGSVVLLRDRL
jgi:hypothetical protein